MVLKNFYKFFKGNGSIHISLFEGVRVLEGRGGHCVELRMLLGSWDCGFVLDV